MTNQQFDSLIEVLQNDSFDWFGFVINIASILIPTLISIYLARKTFKDNLQQSHFESRLMCYSEIANLLAKTRIRAGVYGVDDDLLSQFEQQKFKSQILSSKEVHKLLDKLVSRFEEFQRRSFEEYGSIVIHNSGVKIEIGTLQEVMAIEIREKRDITEKEVQCIRMQKESEYKSSKPNIPPSNQGVSLNVEEANQ